MCQLIPLPICPDRGFPLGGASQHERKPHCAHLASTLALAPGVRVRRGGIGGGVIFLSLSVIYFTQFIEQLMLS